MFQRKKSKKSWFQLLNCFGRNQELDSEIPRNVPDPNLNIRDHWHPAAIDNDEVHRGNRDRMEIINWNDFDDEFADDAIYNIDRLQLRHRNRLELRARLEDDPSLDIYGNILRYVISESVFNIVNDPTWFHMLDQATHARLQRACEMEIGVELPLDWNPFKKMIPKPVKTAQSSVENDGDGDVDGSSTSTRKTSPQHRIQVVASPEFTFELLKFSLQNQGFFTNSHAEFLLKHHRGLKPNYLYFLVPELDLISNSSYYWGKMDRYEAEKLLDGKPEGSFLLRDSTQDDYVFSVSFRKYGRSLHARIEQWNHMFSFDSHDPSFFASDNICDLINHYSDPNCCMFFEPMLISPLSRTQPFSLQQLCRAAITSRLTYNAVDVLNVPISLKSYLKEYNYKQKFRADLLDNIDGSQPSQYQCYLSNQ